MGNDTKRRLAKVAAFLVLATMGSRVLGLVREIVMVTYLGLGPDMGAFTVANKVPNLLRTLLADTALSAAFIPVFSGLLEKKKRREAWQVAYTITVMATIILGVVTVVGMIFAPTVVKLVAPGFKDQSIIDLTVHLMRIQFPTVLIMGLAGILAFVAMFALGFLFLSAAIAISMESPEGLQGVITLLTMPIFFASNALYPVDTFPEILKINWS